MRETLHAVVHRESEVARHRIPHDRPVERELQHLVHDFPHHELARPLPNVERFEEGFPFGVFVIPIVLRREVREEACYFGFGEDAPDRSRPTFERPHDGHLHVHPMRRSKPGTTSASPR